MLGFIFEEEWMFLSEYVFTIMCVGECCYWNTVYQWCNGSSCCWKQGIVTDLTTL